MKKLFFLMSLGLICNVTLLKAQDIINPIGVTMSLPNTLNSPLISIVNGAGLSEFPSITATHENNSQNNALLYFNGVNIIDFDLGGNFDIEGFAFALDKLLSDDNLRQEMGESAYRATIPYFTWDHIVRDFDRELKN